MINQGTAIIRGNMVAATQQDHSPGAPNENIFQSHLNIASLHVFWYLSGRYRHIFIP